VKKIIIITIISLIVFVYFVGCTHTHHITTTPPGANVRIYNTSNRLVFEGTSPSTIRINDWWGRLTSEDSLINVGGNGLMALK